MRLLALQYSGFGCLTALAAFLSLTCPPAVSAQDSPGRFEVGGNVTTLRFNGTGNFRPGAEGDLNFGRHLALDAALTLQPSTPVSRGVEGFFGGKAGLRTGRFGFFGKARPGFISQGHQVREITVTAGSPTTVRSGRLTDPALDLGGVFEYYPSRRWALRSDVGDAVIFGNGTRFNMLGGAMPFSFTTGRTTHNFQFSTSVHYRF